MINVSYGAPSFVCRVLPVHSLEAEFLLDQVERVLRIVHDCGGYVFLLMSDNLSVNQKVFKLLHAKYQSTNLFSINHPVTNSKFSNLYTCFDPIHAFKNLRNNWITEKTQQLSFPNPVDGTRSIAKWSDVVNLYNYDSASILRMTKLTPRALWPGSFDKQKVSLAMHVFDEKVVAAFKSKMPTAETVEFVMEVNRMMKILNVRSPSASLHLNDPDRAPITSTSDPRLNYLCDMAKSFKLMDSSKRGNRIKSLTGDTANAWHVTLLCLVEVTKTLLNLGFSYVLLGKLQSDRLEGEFGKWRGMCGGNYFISADQIRYCLNLCHIQLFNRLEIDPLCSENEICCNIDLYESEEDLDLVDSCFVKYSEVSEHDRSILYYISGYVVKKENIVVLGDPASLEDAQFTELVTRGKLSHPSLNIFEFSMFC